MCVWAGGGGGGVLTPKDVYEMSHQHGDNCQRRQHFVSEPQRVHSTP